MSKSRLATISHDSSIKQSTRTVLRAILSGSYVSGDVSEFVHVCHALAVPHTRRRLRNDVILKQILALDVEDFAYDCIADLFASGDAGEFPHLHAYFAAYPIETLSDEEILSHLRRLVFSHVNHGVFRLYNEVDPSLGRILRNIKLALQEFRSLVLIERFGELCLAPADGDHLLQMRALEIGELESGLRRYLHGSENIPFMLGKLALFLQEQDVAARVISLSTVASVFRSIYAQPEESDVSCADVWEKTTSGDLAAAVHEGVERTKKKMITQYVRKKKIAPDLMETYFGVIETRLNLVYSRDGNEKGLRELLQEQMKDLTDSEYRKKHKNRLEYLSRLTGNIVAKILESD